MARLVAIDRWLYDWQTGVPISLHVVVILLVGRHRWPILGRQKAANLALMQFTTGEYNAGLVAFGWHLFVLGKRLIDSRETTARII